MCPRGQESGRVVDRRMLSDVLAMAERHVLEGDAHLSRQRELIAQLERDGHLNEAARATRLLDTMRETQELHVAHRNRLRRDLGNGG